MKRTSLLVVAALLHASCAHPEPVVRPFPPDGRPIPLLPPALEMPQWWPKHVPPPTKAPAWMAYPESWREA